MIALVCSWAALTCSQPGAAVQVNGAAGAPDALSRGHWLIDEENDEVLLVHPDDRIERFAAGRWPESLVAASDGRVFVTSRQDGQVSVITRDGRLLAIPLGGEPKSLALDETAHRLYVGRVTARDVVVVDVDRLQPMAHAPLPFEPTAMALAGDGLALAGRKASELVMLDALTLAELWREPVPSAGAQPGRILALAARGADVLAAVRFADTGLTQPPVDRGGGYGGTRPTFTPPFSVTVFTLSGAGRGWAPFELPRQTGLTEVSAFVATEETTLVSSRGLRRWVALDSPWRFTQVEDPRAWAPAVSAISADAQGSLALLDAHRRKVLVRDAGMPIRVVALPPSALDPELRRGRELFASLGDRRISQLGMGCVSCHPDGREDGLVWRLQGTERQTPMLAGDRLTATAPYNWLGTAPTLEANLDQTVRQRMLGGGLDAQELHALSRYVREGLRPVRRLAPATEPALVARGRELFTDPDVGCASCHPSDFSFTDGHPHDVESLSERERVDLLRTLSRLTAQGLEPFANPELPSSFDTPSLVGLGLTEPYFHDGSAKTLDDVIAANHDRMGTTSQLSEADRRALVAFLSVL